MTHFHFSFLFDIRNDPSYITTPGKLAQNLTDKKNSGLAESLHACVEGPGLAESVASRTVRVPLEPPTLKTRGLEGTLSNISVNINFIETSQDVKIKAYVITFSLFFYFFLYDYN